jgi:hypothetical protein
MNVFGVIISGQIGMIIEMAKAFDQDLFQRNVLAVKKHIGKMD